MNLYPGKPAPEMDSSDNEFFRIQKFKSLRGLAEDLAGYIESRATLSKAL